MVVTAWVEKTDTDEKDKGKVQEAGTFAKQGDQCGKR